jgi:hypothetical protein
MLIDELITNLKEHGMNMEEHGKVDVSYGGSLFVTKQCFFLRYLLFKYS